MTREKFPEKIPFRLTRMLTNAMEVKQLAVSLFFYFRFLFRHQFVFIFFRQFIFGKIIFLGFVMWDNNFTKVIMFVVYSSVKMLLCC